MLGGCTTQLDQDVLIKHPTVVADWQERAWHVEDIGVDLSSTTNAQGIVPGVFVVKLPIEIAGGLCITQTTILIVDPKGDQREGRVADSDYERMTSNYMSLPEKLDENCVDREFKTRYVHLPSLIEPDIVGEILSFVTSEICKREKCYVSEIRAEFTEYEGTRFAYIVSINNLETRRPTNYLILSRNGGVLQLLKSGLAYD